MANFQVQALALAAGLTIFADSSTATQPPDNVSSDISANTAMGSYALASMGSAVDNTAAGYVALFSDTTGSYNVAFGTGALQENTSGTGNSGFGFEALNVNTTGISNTAAGSGALQSNTQGDGNSAFGNTALSGNTTGAYNTAAGFQALLTNQTGANNTAFGYNALYANVSGKGNAAQGVNALFNNTTGIRNLGIGNNALYTNTTGSYNIALGFEAGYNLTSGSNNIEIGTSGSAADDNTIQIGMQGTQTSTTIAGIYGTQITGSAVYVTATGQLGVLASSERFKTDVQTMGVASAKLARLRPVTFKLKTDAAGTLQYGLIAEEVAKVYPELVIHAANGRIDGVRYEELAPLLLNEVQKQQATIQAQTRQIAALNAQVTKANSQARAIHELQAQVAQLNGLKAALDSALREGRSKDERLAQR
jgi:hypothetical protein